VDRVRRLQHISFALLGETALVRQSEGWSRWISTEGHEGDMRGLTFMWDEATQRTRANLQRKLNPAGRLSKAPRLLELMVVLAAVIQMRMRGDGSTCLQWQPWLAAPMVMLSTKHEHVLSGLAGALPVNFLDRDSIKAFAQHVAVAMACMCYDSASSNIASVARMIAFLEKLPVWASNVVVHPERCLTHAVHIVKAYTLADNRLASE